MTRSRRPLGLAPALRVLGCLIVALSLAACASFGGLGNLGSGRGGAAADGETLGSGSVRVAMLLPLGAGGNASETARAFRNATELAMRDFPGAGIQVTVYDTTGTPAGSQSAVSKALAGGAELILGPIFSNEVSAVAQQARAAGVPVVAFSSDAGVAGPGVYLLSFLPSDDVRRIVAYAAGEGRRSFAALLPANAYGAVVEGAFRSNVAAAGGRVVAVKSYQANNADISSKAAEIAAIAPQIDALFMPDSGDVVPALAAALAAQGVTRARVRFLGSGQWDDQRVLGEGALVGAWYPAPIKQGYQDFARKYRAAFGALPPRNATLAYDATVLAAGLVRQYGSDGFKASVLASSNGYAGIDGIFRFLPSGLTERRFAVYEVTGAGARIVSPAARSFGAGG